MTVLRKQLHWLFTSIIILLTASCVSVPQNRYEGQRNYTNQPHGYGTSVEPNGNNYVGEWKDGKRNGRGKQVWPGNATYVGEWKDDNLHGRGTITLSSGETYEGEWKDGKRNGRGTATLSNGESYEGEWENDRKHGQGTANFSFGGKYEGGYSRGFFEGKGTLTDTRGKTVSGNFQNWRFNGPFLEGQIDGKDYNFSLFTGQVQASDQEYGDLDKVTTASSELLQDISIRCQTNKDCPQGSSCRSNSGGGTECRTESGVSVVDNLAARVALACEKTSDCPAGMSCRSKVGGGAECREESLTETNYLDESQNLPSTSLPANEPSANPSVPDTPVLEAQSRLALLIGNADYQTSPLANPVNDVRGMATALRKAGFTVIKHENLNFKQMRNAVRDFGEKLSKDHVGFFYYSGHGVQVDGKNYLIPVNSDIKYEDEVATSALDADMVLAKLESAKNKLNIVVLDACRDSPLGRRTRTSTKGLSNMNAASGTMIAFSTAPGQVALDGKGSNSPYTKHLISAIQKEGLLLEQVFKEVRGNVMKDTNGTQVPWENSSILGDFYFVPKRD